MAGYNPSTDSKWKCWQPIECVGTFETSLAGIFLPQSTSAPLQVSVTGAKTPNGGLVAGSELWSVARLSAGKFTVTLAPQWGAGAGAGGLGAATTSKIKSIRVGLQMNSRTNLKLTISNVNTAAGTFEIDCVNPNTGIYTDIAANSNNSISFEIRTSQGGPSNVQNN